MISLDKAVSNRTDSRLAEPPSVSLPKGGGAIRGMGETFSSNPVTGTGTVTVPIGASPGRGGFGPALSLTYDSGAGQGPFGLGWKLPLPAITRKTDTGLPRYADSSDSDSFVYSETDDLVPELNPDGTLFEDDSTVGGYAIRRYRPRIEGAFARIERWMRLSDGDLHWRSFSKDNILSIYGATPESRISDPSNPLHVFSWLLCETRDTKGNAILYKYKAENADGVDLTHAHERHRGGIDGSARTAARYIKEIRYGNAQPLLDAAGERPRFVTAGQIEQTEWLFRVVFDYGEHHPTAPEPSPSNGWLCRPDPFSTYRAGFELRHYRLCRRILMFHHFPEEAGVGGNCLVRSTRFRYRETPIGTYLTQVEQAGHKRSGGGYLEQAMPPLEFAYSESVIGQTVEDVDPGSLDPMPSGLADGMSIWVDLDGEGSSGILTEQAGAWYYKRNKSALVHPDSDEANTARFAAPELVAAVPADVSVRRGEWQFHDLAGDGRTDVVKRGEGASGFFEWSSVGEWETFRPFASMPNVDWSSPNVKFLDLTGDGRPDLCVTEEQAVAWYPSLGEEGYGEGERFAFPADREQAPLAVMSDPAETIFLADLSGDGLTDIVRIRNGEVCYWPNLGYGRFGAKITMDDAPWFDAPDLFDARRIRLADVDGSGVADIVYLGRENARLWLNRSGNAWSDAVELPAFPESHPFAYAQVIDLLGNGTACLVWSSPLPASERTSMKYINLMAQGKPHLLVGIRNNLGAETRIRYVPSTHFYLKDKSEGKPWITKLPFPVHVVERVETIDRITRNRFATRYAYHHGYYDGEEREFRGFGMVEQWDGELEASIEAGRDGASATSADPASHVPPVYTKTWYHTGCYAGRDRVSNYFAGRPGDGEYYREPGIDEEEALAMLLPDTDLPAGLTAEEEREACRALKGSLLRQEVYALDGTPEEPHPYTVAEQTFAVRCLQRREGNKHASFFAYPKEGLTHHYERNPQDPRTVHALTLEVDSYGNALKDITIAYGRRKPDDALPVADRAKQAMTAVAYSEKRMTNGIGDAHAHTDHYRAPLLCETRVYELTGYMPTGSAGRFRSEDFAEEIGEGRFALRFERELGYEERPGSGRERRLVKHSRTLYRSDDLSALLELGKLEACALAGESYVLALTPGILAAGYERNGEQLLPNPEDALGGDGADRGGYVSGREQKALGLFPGQDPDDCWWVPSGRMFLSPGSDDAAEEERAYAQAHFFMPCRFRDAFRQESFVRYDRYRLFVVESRDPAGNCVTAGERTPEGGIDDSKPGIDYRVLQPRLMTDPNLNRTEVVYDVLGMATGTAAMGKAGRDEGDSTDRFEADLAPSQIEAFMQQPAERAPSLLGSATTRLVCDLYAYMRTMHEPQPQPASVSVLARETHESELKDGEMTSVMLQLTYYDGFGRVLQAKSPAQRERSADGESGPARWICSGRVVYNNKGKPVRKYEPFFGLDHKYEHGAQAGVSSVLFYDPLDRLVATLHPDHTYEKIVFDPWKQLNYDPNDTVCPRGRETGDPRSDPDVRGYMSRYFGIIEAQAGQPWRTWFEQRQDGSMGSVEADASVRAAAHADTPSVAYLDAQGRPFLTRAHNGYDPDGNAILLDSRVELDIEGNRLAIRDAVKPQGEPSGRVVMRSTYDMLGNRIRHVSMDAGERWMLVDCAGKSIRSWDSRGTRYRIEHDALRRPARAYVQGLDPVDPEAEILAERFVYGERHPHAEERNLRGKTFLHLDQAGAAWNDAYDFKGNVLQSSRRLLRNYKQTADWTAAEAALPDIGEGAFDEEAAESAWRHLLEQETFAARSSYDALGRETTMTTPHHASMAPSTIRSRYNESGLLERVDVRLNDAEDERGNPIWTPFVAGIEYDAMGRRQRVSFGNGVSTTYRFDPLTHRLTRMISTRKESKFSLDCPSPPVDGWPGCRIQNLRYTYDPAGNVVHVQDDAQQSVFFRNRRVDPSSTYRYDPLYRLIEASGREHLGQAVAPAAPHSERDEPRTRIPWSANDGAAMAAYSERYTYDAAGNMLEMRHVSAQANAGWTRRYSYAEAGLTEGDVAAASNRLSRSGIGGDAGADDAYIYDAHGNAIRMPHLGGGGPEPNMHWNFRDRLSRIDLGGGGTAYYVYDAAGARVRKVWEKSPNRLEERIYLGGFELFRVRNGDGDLQLERETLHVSANKQRIAMVETLTFDAAGDDPSPPRLTRYHLTNQIGSSSLELDDEAHIISYEEYSPFGSTTYQAVRSLTETPKRYRYSGKERDEESGFYYYGARYFAPWLGRWISCDAVEKPNRYHYVGNNPIRFEDPDGNEENEGANRFWGAMRMLGGAGQLALGVVALAAPEPTMLTKAAGAIAVVNGSDDFMTGMRQLITGRQERGAIETTVSVTAEAAGMERRNAEALGTATSTVLGFVSPGGAVSNGPRAGMALVTNTGEQFATGIAVSSQVVGHARAAQLSGHGTQAVATMMSSQDRSSSPSGSSSRGGGASDPPPAASGSAGNSGGGPDRLPDGLADEALNGLEQGGETGGFRAIGKHLDDLTSHSQSRMAKAERGLPNHQSAHTGPQAALRNLHNYDPQAALTRILDKAAHSGFDAYWKQVFRQRWGSTGEKTITAGELFEAVSEAARRNPHFSKAEANSVIELLRDELFVQLGLTEDSLVRLPYSR